MLSSSVAGVAGCAAAIELRSAGYRVGLLYKRDDVTRVESLSPGAVHDLHRLSVDMGRSISEVVAWWGFRARQAGKLP